MIETVKRISRVSSVPEALRFHRLRLRADPEPCTSSDPDPKGTAIENHAGIQGGFTQRYNRLHRTSGHLFQGRFKAILCDRDAYLLELVRYIHLNPARIRQPHDPWEYRWSSHRAYLGERTPVEVKSGELLA